MRCAVCGGALDLESRRCDACLRARAEAAERDAVLELSPGAGPRGLELDLASGPGTSPRAMRSAAELHEPQAPVLGALDLGLDVDRSAPLAASPPASGPNERDGWLPLPTSPPSARPSAAPAPFGVPGPGFSRPPPGAKLPPGVELPDLRALASLPPSHPLHGLGETKPPTDLSLRFDYDTPIVNGFALPVAFAFAALLVLAQADFLLYSTVCMWTHELGHAAAGWLGGFFSIPLPFFTIYTSDDRNYLVIGLVIALWAWLGYRGVTRRSPGLVAGAASIAGLQIWLTFLSVPGRALQWFTYGGLAGELLLSTAMMLAFYVKLPWRWDFWRYVVLLTCAPAYLYSTLRWIRVKLGTADLPRGSAIGDSSEGDVEKLLRTGEFTERTLASTSLAIALGCGVVLVLVYLRMLKKAYRLQEQRAVPESSTGSER